MAQRDLANHVRPGVMTDSPSRHASTQTHYRIDDVGKFPGDLIFILHRGRVFYKIAEGWDFGSVVTVTDQGGDAVMGPAGWTQAELQLTVDTRPERTKRWDRMKRRHGHKTWADTIGDTPR